MSLVTDWQFELQDNPYLLDALNPLQRFAKTAISLVRKASLSEDILLFLSYLRTIVLCYLERAIA
jgi:hypothetical protein